MSNPTGQIIVNNAYTLLGILEQGGTLSASDSNDGLAELNAMWDAWGIDEGLIFSVAEIVASTSFGAASYTIGPGASINVARPNRLYQAFAGASTARVPIKVVSAAEYYAHRDLTASGATPDEIYPDFNVDPVTGYAKIYLFPVPNGVYSIFLYVGVAFATWVLATAYNIPEGYQDPIQSALAFRLIARNVGSVPQEIVQLVTSLAQKAEARIREMNAKNRQLPLPESVNPEAQQAGASQAKG